VRPRANTDGGIANDSSSATATSSAANDAGTGIVSSTTTRSNRHASARMPISTPVVRNAGVIVRSGGAW
jgi:hypothetical protein